VSGSIFDRQENFKRQSEHHGGVTAGAEEAKIPTPCLGKEHFDRPVYELSDFRYSSRKIHNLYNDMRYMWSFRVSDTANGYGLSCELEPSTIDDMTDRMWGLSTCVPDGVDWSQMENTTSRFMGLAKLSYQATDPEIQREVPVEFAQMWVCVAEEGVP
jgi:hypothetical protein